MFKESLARVRNLSKPSDYWRQLEIQAYHKGLAEGQDFGERIAHNRTLVKELPEILNRYTRLQVKIMNKPAKVMEQKLAEFTDKELERLKMDMQR